MKGNEGLQRRSGYLCPKREHQLDLWYAIVFVRPGMRPPDMRDTRKFSKHLGGAQTVHLDKLLYDECPDVCWKVWAFTRHVRTDARRMHESFASSLVRTGTSSRLEVTFVDCRCRGSDGRVRSGRVWKFRYDAVFACEGLFDGGEHRRSCECVSFTVARIM